MSKFSIGDRVFYDDNPGRVIETDSFRSPVTGNIILTCDVKWDGHGEVSTVWESDLMSEEDYTALFRETYYEDY